MAGHAGRRPADPQADHQQFPYVIAFEKHEQHVLILAVAHARRRPLYWLTHEPLKVQLRRAAPMTEEEGTTFLNVDLEVISRTPLDPLVEAFGRKVDVLHVGPWGQRYGAHPTLLGCF